VVSLPTQGMDVNIVCVYLVCAVLCVEVFRRADPPSKGSYRLCIDNETLKAAKVHKGCRTIDR
jgi:hypothetical protein